MPATDQAPKNEAGIRSFLAAKLSTIDRRSNGSYYLRRMAVTGMGYGHNRRNCQVQYRGPGITRLAFSDEDRAGEYIQELMGQAASPCVATPSATSSQVGGDNARVPAVATGHTSTPYPRVGAMTAS
jgi:hypothetical protein